MKSKDLKKVEAVERQKIYDKLTGSQKITKLDLKYGKGFGAIKERAKLTKTLNLKVESSVEKSKTKPVFASKAEERRWEHHQKQKNNK